MAGNTITNLRNPLSNRMV